MRHFIEVCYKGTNYAGFQVQANANTIQNEVERVFNIFFRSPVKLTGSSRTDAGVHANQNYFHFDFPETIAPNVLFNLNALLPFDIAIKSITEVPPDSHCRFDAISREYRYSIYSFKNPFLFQTAWYYPYTIDITLLQAAAKIVMENTDFTSFSKRNSQVHTHNCTLTTSSWQLQEGQLIYKVIGNRFLRGMVRGLVGTMLQVARGAMSLEQLSEVFQAKDCSKANFSTPAHGLVLQSVLYPDDYFEKVDQL